MKIEKLHIDGFGIFHDKNIQGFENGINVIYGSNEAGKSTLLDFIRFTLFEYPHWHRDRRPPLRGGEHGGRIWLRNSAAEPLMVYRHGNDKDFQLEYQGETTNNETIYHKMIGNASIDLYKNIYAITIDELSDVDQLGESGMEDRIFSMGMGLSGVDFGGFEKSLIAHTKAYFKTKGSIQVLPKLVSEIEKKEKAINELRSKLGEYNRLSEELETLESKIEALEEARSKLSLEKNHFSDLSKAYPHYVKYKEAEAKIVAIGAVEEHPVQLLEQYEEQKRELQNEQSSFEDIVQRMEQLEEGLEQLNWDAELSKHAHLLDFFKTNIKQYEEAKNQRNQAIEKIANAKNGSASVLERLGEEVDAQHLIQLSGTFELQSEATSVAEEQRSLAQNINTKQETESRLRKELSELKTRKENLDAHVKTLSIQSATQKDEAKEKEITLDTAFKSALENTGRTAPKKNKLPLVLTLVFLITGAGLLFVNYISGGIVLGLSVFGLLVVLLQKKETPVEKAMDQSPNEINRTLNELRDEIQRYSEWEEKDKALTEQFAIKSDEVQKSEKELLELQKQLSTSEENWKNKLKGLQLPITLLPSRMNDFISNVEELKRQSEAKKEAEKTIKNIDFLIASFEEKLADILSPKQEMEVAAVYSLINKMEENEKIHHQHQRYTEDLSKLSKEKEIKSKNIDKINTAIETLFSQVNIKEESAFYQHFERQSQLSAAKEEKESAANTIKTLCGEDQLEETITQLSDFTPSELNVHKENTAANYEKTKTEYDDLNKDWATTKTDIRHILEIDEMYGLQNEKESLQAQLKEETKEWLATKLALAVLDQSKQKYEQERQPEVITQTRDYFRTITENAYEDLRISLSERHVSIIDAAGNAKTVEELSRGTREQLLLALRLGLIAEYEKSAEPLPVAFDDIMVNFDAERTANLAKILSDFSKDRQVLYFTCHEHTKELFKEYGANVIEWR